MESFLSIMKRQSSKKEDEKFKKEDDIDRGRNLDALFIINMHQYWKSYDSYSEFISNLISHYDPSRTELEFRSKFIQPQKKKKILIEKQKRIGKLFIKNQTFLDVNSSFGDYSLQNDYNRIQSKFSFCSIRTNNCIFNGKWFYEVILLSNGQQQIGFCQTRTPFSPSEGVGTDQLSYAYDGFKMKKWHNTAENSGEMLDFGDVIGVCINFQKKCIKYYVNGKKTEICFNNILTGKNVAYFPAVSMGIKEKNQFNFGTLPTYYSYPGYERIDLPSCEYNGKMEVLNTLLSIFMNFLLPSFLNEKNIDKYNKLLLNKKIFDFFVKVAFYDFFLCKTLLFPFMIHNIKQNLGNYQIFIDELKQNAKIQTKNQMSNLFSEIIRKICNIIEELSYMGEKKIIDYENFMNLLIQLLSDDEIYDIWMKSPNMMGELSYLLTSNSFNIRDLLRKVNEKYGNDKSTPMGQILKVLIQKKEIETPKMLQTERKYFEMQTKFYLKYFEMGEKKIQIIQNTVIIYKMLTQIYSPELLNQYTTFQQIYNEKNKRNIIAIKNIFYSYFNFFLEKFEQFPINKFPIGSATISQLQKTLYLDEDEIINTTENGIPNAYYNEENIGGNIISVLKLYPFDIKYIYKGTENFSSLYFNLLVRIISPTEKMLKIYEIIFALCKAVKYEHFIEDDRASTKIISFFKFYFYLFNQECQLILFKISYFIIEWLYYVLVKKNEDYIFILPISLIDFPFEVAQKLVLFKSRLLVDKEYFLEIFKDSKKKYDYFLLKAISLCLTIFNNKKLKGNVQLISSLMKKLFFFLKKGLTSKIILSNPKFITQLIQGVLNIIDRDDYSKYIGKIIGKLVFYSCYCGRIFSKDEPTDYTCIFKNEEKQLLFVTFVQKYSKQLNKKLTSYIFNLEFSKENIIDKNYICDKTQSYLSLIKKTFLSMCICINIYEFGIKMYPHIFFDKNSIHFIQFRSFLINLSSRILNEPYITCIFDLFFHYKKNTHLLVLFGFAVIGLFISCQSSEYFNQFIDMIINNDEIFTQPFISLYEKIDQLTKSEIGRKTKYLQYSNEGQIHKGLEKYKMIAEEMHKKKKTTKAETLKNLVLDEENEDKLCILCYNNIANKKMIPCNHIACNECLMQYMTEKTICFLCHRIIEDIKDYTY